MASVDGSRTYLASSDEVLQQPCGPCKDDGETKEAKYLCEFCNVYLCFDCRNDHKTFKATKNHSIAPADSGSSIAKEAFAILCGCNQKRAVEVYCEKHDKVICSLCETVKHRNCKASPIKDKVSRDTKKQLKVVMDKAKSLKTAIENCKKDVEENRNKLYDTKGECKKEISAYRREINEILDKMEKEALENLETRANRQLQAIQKQIAVLLASLQTLDTDFCIIDKAYKTNREEIMFSANVKCSKSISEYDELINDMVNNLQLPKLNFQRNTQLTDVLKREEGLGRLEPSEELSSKQDNVSVIIPDMKLKSIRKVNIKSPDDDRTPYIIDSTFMSNGYVLLCDHLNRNVKLLDSDLSVKQCLKLSKDPYNVAAVRENEAIINMRSDVQYIYTHPDLKLGKKVTLPDKCYGLKVVNDEIYTACYKGSGHDEIWRLDRAGNIISKTALTQSSSGCSYNLGLCLARSRPRVYLTDWANSRVTCFQLDGKMVYQYEDKELERPEGIYVDSAGNSLVCGTNSHNVVVITANGKKHGELLTSKDIESPRCIDYRPEDNTLIIGCCNNSKLYIYKLEK